VSPSLPALVILPWAGALLLALLPRARWAAFANIGVSALGFLLAIALFEVPLGVSGWLHLDALNLGLLLLAGFVGLTTSIFSAATLHGESFTPRLSRLYHAAFQIFLGANNLALLSDNLGLMWVAIELATIATVLMVALHRTPAAIEAAWKFFILCGVGIGLALFGTIVIALAARPLLSEPEAVLSLAALAGVVAKADPGLLTLGFLFLLLGYGTKAGLVPLHGWLPDAHAEGPIAISAVLSGLLLNSALHAVLRAKALIGLNPAAIAPGPLMIALGLASLLLAAFSLWRRRDARRFFAWSSIEHMGLAAIAFGLGGPIGNAAGLLHMAGHSLIKSAIFFGLGGAIIAKGSQKLADITGLTVSHPALGWGLLLAVMGIAGLPPFAIFASEFGLALETARQAPWLLAPIGLGLLVAMAAMVTTAQSLCFGKPGRDAPLWLHLFVALVLGIAMPTAATALLGAASLLAGS